METTAVSPKEYRLVAIAFAFYTLSHPATHTIARVQMEIIQLILLTNLTEQHVCPAVFRTYALFSSLGFCYSESIFRTVSHVKLLSSSRMKVL